MKTGLLVTSNPEMFCQSVPITKLIEFHREKWTGDNWISLYKVPSCVITAVDRIRAEVRSARTPGASVCLCCCISVGLDDLIATPSLRRLADLKEKIDRISSIGGDELELLCSWFRAFSVSIAVVGSSASVPKISIRVGDDLHNDLCEWSSRLGISKSNLATLCAIRSISHQPETINSVAKSLESNIENFLQLARIRVKMAEGLIEVMKS